MSQQCKSNVLVTTWEKNSVSLPPKKIIKLRKKVLFYQIGSGLKKLPAINQELCSMCRAKFHEAVKQKILLSNLFFAKQKMSGAPVVTKVNFIEFWLVTGFC